MSSDSLNNTFIKYDNLICINDCSYSLCNDNKCRILNFLRKSFSKDLISLHIKS